MNGETAHLFRQGSQEIDEFEFRKSLPDERDSRLIGDRQTICLIQKLNYRKRLIDERIEQGVSAPYRRLRAGFDDVG